MKALRAVRKLVLGETWVLPLGVAAAVGLAAGVRALAGAHGWWRSAGGPLLVVLVLGVLAASVRGSAR